MEKVAFDTRAYVDDLMQKMEQAVAPALISQDYGTAAHLLKARLTEAHFEMRQPWIEERIKSGGTFNVAVEMLLENLTAGTDPSHSWKMVRTYYQQGKLPEGQETDERPLELDLG